MTKIAIINADLEFFKECRQGRREVSKEYGNDVVFSRATRRRRPISPRSSATSMPPIRKRSSSPPIRLTSAAIIRGVKEIGISDQVRLLRRRHGRSAYGAL